MRHTAALTALVIAILTGQDLFSAAGRFSDRIYQPSSGKTLGLGQILPDLERVRIIFMGEQHSDERHHDLQLRVVRTMKNLGTPVAIGLEMFTARDQAYLDSWVQGTLSEKEFRTAHERNWGDTWGLYSSLYRYARAKGIPLLGLNVPEEITSQVADRGFSSLSPQQKAQLPMVSCDVDRDYESFIRQALSAHNLPGESRKFENFCEAQLIWDATMAYRLVRYTESHPEVTVLVIAGNSHSWRPGIPGQLGRFSDGVDYRILLPEVPPVQTRRTMDGTMADYLWLLE